ncbi:hypothetical protein ALC57_06110 [Trachymyrmex cornetzi]|uniref:Uncharacterized protein n=1 Tax=Trachymyrmex cornetzi TaxID=471704 RepID=A0A195E8Q6_9HYME|nr:hypothetical protein ALC57_06110 [Trachymyrmex cornetzi]
MGCSERIGCFIYQPTSLNNESTSLRSTSGLSNTSSTAVLAKR